MLTYPLEKRGKTPIYRYLYQCIRDDIIAGNLAKGTKLPSKRELAQNLNVSVITIQMPTKNCRLKVISPQLNDEASCPA